jgi:hypothetical protein
MALPEGMYLSASADKSSRSKLFRPKEITEIVFPGIGMIMHDIFWVKYTIYLEDRGYEVHSQEHLLLWAEKDGIKKPTEGVLYYSLLSEYISDIGEIEDSVSAGSDATKNWIFKSPEETGYSHYEAVMDDILTAANNPEEFDIGGFIENRLSSDFRGKCSESGIEPKRILEDRLSKINVDSDDSERNRYEGVLAAFTKALADMFDRDRYDRLHRNKSENIIESNMNFATDLIEEVGLSQIETLANTDFSFTQEEVATLVEAIQQKKNGEYLAGSILIITYLNRVHGGDTRDIYGIYQENKDLVEDARSYLPTVSFSSEVIEKLEILCFYWKVNYFLADGEDMARKKIMGEGGDYTETIDLGMVERWLEETESGENVVEFIDDLINKGWLDELERLIEKMKREGEEDIVEFFEKLHEGVGANRSPAEIYLDLLEQRGTVRREAEEVYRMEFEPSTSGSAGFYGIDPLTDWTEAMIRYQ